MKNILYFSLPFFLSLAPSAHASPSPIAEADPASESPSPAPAPCTIRSPFSGSFFDLNPLHIVLPDDPLAKTQKHVRDWSWNATGWDLPYNFTMNFCGGVVEDLRKMGGVEGVEEGRWRNVSAFYTREGKVYSIGQQNTQPVIRGRKLVLNYTDGSPCPPITPDRRRAELEPLSRSDFFSDSSAESNSTRDLDTADDSSLTTYSSDRQKMTIISLLCDRDPLNPPLTLSYVATPDECTYFFEARSSAACAGIEQAKQTLSPSGVFGVIAIIALLVYLVGGCVYSRTVLNQRGWRQLPNYSLWAGIFGFFRDIFIILFSSCARCLPGRRGYQQVNGGIGRGGRAGRDSEAENRLIDELNEEWDD